MISIGYSGNDERTYFSWNNALPAYYRFKTFTFVFA